MKKNKKETAEKERIRKENAIFRTCFKVTNDYWGPSYKMSNGTMMVCVTLLTGINDDIIVQVWGQDDTGRQKLFREEQRGDAIKMYNDVLDLPFVDMVELDKLGLDRA